MVRRGVDARWRYEKKISSTLSGFNPTTGAVFYPANSYLDRWLKQRSRDPRSFNLDDGLIGEVMFLVHDYLHVWSYQWIRALMPKLGFGYAPVTAKNFESFVFCHLLTEAVATVGLDYWFLSAVNLNERVGIGTNFKSLTVSYRLEDEDEYRRFQPDFTAQRKSFLMELTRFYCDGNFVGFSKNDLRRSPKLLGWLSHELEYGVNQRAYARLWLKFLSPEKITVDEDRAGGKVRCDEPWMKRLVHDLSDLLWAKVRESELNPAPKMSARGPSWKAPLRRKSIDFRFVNWNALQNSEKFDRLDFNLGSETNFRYWFHQFVSQFDYGRIDGELLELMPELLRKRNRGICEYLFRDQRRLRRNSDEPVDLFFLS